MQGVELRVRFPQPLRRLLTFPSVHQGWFEGASGLGSERSQGLDRTGSANAAVSRGRANEAQHPETPREPAQMVISVVLS